MTKKIVIALGGNALQSGSGPATAEAQLEIVRKTCAYIADICSAGHEVTLVHGNGPQVGRILLASETAKDVTPAMPFDVCGAMSQGYIGYHLQLCLGEALRKRGASKSVVTLVTQVVVAEDDPGFQNPTKPIGAFYGEVEAKALAQDKGYVMKEDAGRGYRRVVASPLPKEIVEIDAIKKLRETAVVITCGGGGIPVLRKADGGLAGTAAVIDKDFAAELLAEEIGADALVILTEVEYVAIDYNKPTQKNLTKMTLAEGERYIAENQFAPGSMLPKVQAAMKFVKANPSGEAIISALDKAADAIAGKTGTVVVK